MKKPSPKPTKKTTTAKSKANAAPKNRPAVGYDKKMPNTWRNGWTN